MQRKLLLIDGSSLLTTHYHGNLPRQLQGVKDMTKREALFSKILHTSDGVYTNAMFGMLKAILKIIKEQQPSHIAVAWDVSRNTFVVRLHQLIRAIVNLRMHHLKNSLFICKIY